jgi:hypothetical protein
MSASAMDFKEFLIAMSALVLVIGYTPTNHESKFYRPARVGLLRRLNKEHTTSPKAQNARSSEWIEKDAAKLSLFVLTLELHFIA